MLNPKEYEVLVKQVLRSQNDQVNIKLFPKQGKSLRIEINSLLPNVRSDS